LCVNLIEPERRAKEKKPFQLKDLEREMVLKRMRDAAQGLSVDEDYEEAGQRRADELLRARAANRGYFEEQEDIKRR